MKKILFAIVCAFTCITGLSAQTVDDLFKEFKDKNNVECVNIPKALLSMAPAVMKKEKGFALYFDRNQT